MQLIFECQNLKVMTLDDKAGIFPVMPLKIIILGAISLNHFKSLEKHSHSELLGDSFNLYMINLLFLLLKMILHFRRISNIAPSIVIAVFCHL